jgi:succinyl-CoA synthetase beta subunit
VVPPLNEHQTKQLLAPFGITFLPGTPAANAAEAVAAAAQIGYPVVLKILSTDILHKTEVGGVRLQIADEAQLRQACDAMLESVTRQVPQARIDGFLVQPMATGGVAELIAGVTHDPVFGPALTVGLGGVLTEIYQDASHRLLPADKGMVQDMLRELTAWPLLDGFRGRPLADVDACCQMVAALSDAQQSLGHRISDIEINPIQVHAQGKGAWGLDALVLFTPQETQGDTV